jgi:hypothetical protein
MVIYLRDGGIWWDLVGFGRIWGGEPCFEEDFSGCSFEKE